MRNRFNLWTFAWVLFFLLAISGGLFLMGSRESQSDPSASSFGPSGTRAFVELMTEAGYRCDVRRDARPRFDRNDFVLGFTLATEVPLPIESPTANEAEKAVRAHIEGGGRAFLLEVPEDFSQATRRSADGTRIGVFEAGALPAGSPKQLELTAGRVLNTTFGESIARLEDPKIALVSSGANEPLLELHASGKGMIGVLRDATGATNRFLDKHQNATFLLWALGSLNPQKARIVIVEALHGEIVEPGLLGLIGSWASAGWWQLLFVLGVIAYTLGRRFGLPEVDSTQQRSGRELVDAYADTMKRSAKAQVALARVVAEADRRIRRRYNLPNELSVSRRNEMIPPSLAAVLTRAELAAKSSLTADAATALVFDLEDELAAIDHAAAPRRKRRRR